MTNSHSEWSGPRMTILRLLELTEEYLKGSGHNGQFRSEVTEFRHELADRLLRETLRDEWPRRRSTTDTEERLTSNAYETTMSDDEPTNAADVLAEMTGRDREMVVPDDDVEYPPLDELEIVDDEE